MDNAKRIGYSNTSVHTVMSTNSEYIVGETTATPFKTERTWMNCGTTSSMHAVGNGVLGNLTSCSGVYLPIKVERQVFAGPGE